jgi:hypothetical protein
MKFDVGKLIFVGTLQLCLKWIRPGPNGSMGRLDTRVSRAQLPRTSLKNSKGNAIRATGREGP